MQKNKTGRYFKYAIGEIVLIIVGILIAVSINTWNENRKDKIEEQSILNDLKKEMQANLEDLEIVIEEHEKSFEGTKEIRALFNDRDTFDQMRDSVFMLLFNKMNKNYTYDPKHGILNSVISSGKINLLSNKELKYLLASLKESIVDAMESTMKIENQRDDLLYQSYINSSIIKDGKRVGFNPKLMFDDPPFRIATNNLFFHIRREGLEEEHELKSTFEHIIKLLDQEINK